MTTEESDEEFFVERRRRKRRRDQSRRRDSESEESEEEEEEELAQPARAPRRSLRQVPNVVRYDSITCGMDTPNRGRSNYHTFRSRGGLSYVGAPTGSGSSRQNSSQVTPSRRVGFSYELGERVIRADGGGEGPQADQGYLVTRRFLRGSKRYYQLLGYFHDRFTGVFLEDELVSLREYLELTDEGWPNFRTTDEIDVNNNNSSDNNEENATPVDLRTETNRRRRQILRTLRQNLH